MKWPKRTTEKQTILEEILNAVSHGLMVPVSIVIFCIFCIEKGFKFPLFLLTLTMFMLYLMSCLYHSLSFTKAKRHFQRFDHICIYLLIWGSFLPFLFSSEEKKLFNLIFCILQSFVILIGILLKIFQFHKGDKIHLILFLLLGWSGIWVIFDSWSIVNQNYNILLFLFLGGFFYSVGILFYNELYKKYYHFIWHLFVILANLCHVYSIFLLIK
ncbi:PAQR family membrane homeostasis protein TrhA [Candidatus Phytoplasma sp. AldY-WA1]|jgi:hemolysin III|uniref:PAQR family membrane homeostasis protein TrhA n=1 Tax=Candidatus Phytoplasma sp. AldY-WA1 TaxID=2852100 RepID=UPI001CE38222|nr:hemolysin III family protein [Candidatus Phytoplasma sp. AldY-WA1]